MKVVVIPDVHLKPWMFMRAERILESGRAEKAVCLMDIPDDWDRQYNIDLYIQTFDEAIRFEKKFQDTLWCLGNHDVSYLWKRMQSGYSVFAASAVRLKLNELFNAAPDMKYFRYIHRIDDVLFSHAGLTEYFARLHESENVIEEINGLGADELWNDDSPLWARPVRGRLRAYMADEMLQVTGHTPVECIKRNENTIFCDVFSTYRDGSPIGSQEFLLLDTKTWEYRGVKL